MLMPALPTTYLAELAQAGLPKALLTRLADEWRDPATTGAVVELLRSGAVPPAIHTLYMNLLVRFGRSHATDLRGILPLVGAFHLKFWDLDDADGRVSAPIRDLGALLAGSEFAGTLCSEWGGHEWLVDADAADMTRRHLALVPLRARGWRGRSLTTTERTTRTEGEPMPYAVGDLTTSFTLPRAGGGRSTVETAGAPATVLVWTCNHCPYALAWHDRIQEVIRDYAGRGVAFAQINANDEEKYPADSFTEMERRVDAGEFASDFLQDAEQSLSKQWGARVTPDVFVLDADGRIVYRGAPDADHGDPAQNAAHLRDVLDDVLAGRPARIDGTPAAGCKIKWTVDDQPNPYV